MPPPDQTPQVLRIAPVSPLPRPRVHSLSPVARPLPAAPAVRLGASNPAPGSPLAASAHTSPYPALAAPWPKSPVAAVEAIRPAHPPLATLAMSLASAQATPAPSKKFSPTRLGLKFTRKFTFSTRCPAPVSGIGIGPVANAGFGLGSGTTTLGLSLIRTSDTTRSPAGASPMPPLRHNHTAVPSTVACTAIDTATQRNKDRPIMGTVTLPRTPMPRKQKTGRDQGHGRRGGLEARPNRHMVINGPKCNVHIITVHPNK